MTKKACLRDNLLLSATGPQGDMAPGAQKVVEHGLYVSCVCVNPHVVAATQTTDQDIEVFKFLLKHIFSFSGSCARPVGSLNVIHAWWADHANSLGSFNEYEFWTKLTPIRKGEWLASNSLNDYIIPTPDLLVAENRALPCPVIDLAQ